MSDTVTNIICTSLEDVEDAIDTLTSRGYIVESGLLEEQIETGDTGIAVCYRDGELNHEVDVYSQSTVHRLIQQLREMWPEEIRVSYREWCGTGAEHGTN